jgi:hypothetical protein
MTNGRGGQESPQLPLWQSHDISKMMQVNVTTSAIGEVAGRR